MCLFIHMGSDWGSAHIYSVQCYNNLRNQPCHIEHAVEKQSDEDIRKIDCMLEHQSMQSIG
jgi:hypothetical protein